MHNNLEDLIGASLEALLTEFRPVSDKRTDWFSSRCIIWQYVMHLWEWERIFCEDTHFELVVFFSPVACGAVRTKHVPTTGESDIFVSTPFTCL